MFRTSFIHAMSCNLLSTLYSSLFSCPPAFLSWKNSYINVLAFGLLMQNVQQRPGLSEWQKVKGGRGALHSDLWEVVYRPSLLEVQKCPVEQVKGIFTEINYRFIQMFSVSYKNNLKTLLQLKFSVLIIKNAIRKTQADMCIGVKGMLVKGICKYLHTKNCLTCASHKHSMIRLMNVK